MLVPKFSALADSLSLQAKEYFEKAVDHDEAGGHYNLGVMYLKGVGVKRDVKLACNYFIMAAKEGQPKAFYQLAKMFHTGVGLKRNLPMVSWDSRVSFLLFNCLYLFISFIFLLIYMIHYSCFFIFNPDPFWWKFA